MYQIQEPYQSGHLAVSPIHQIYYEVSGNPQGKPVIFLHGGPGGGCSPLHRGFFDPERYQIVLIDQRGAGRSLPYACIEENTTWDLVDDIERVRELLRIEQWLVFGGSWGSTLALAYAQTYPHRVTELILRGIFLGRQQEYDWICRFGANAVFPEYWPEFQDFVPEGQRHDLVAAYRHLMRPDNPNRAEMLAAASAWAKWESHIIHLAHNQEAVDEYNDGEAALAIARIENHYFTHRCWLDNERALLQNMDKIRHIPTIIVQGRYDMCTPVQAAFDVKQAFPEAELRIVQAGHSAFEPAIAQALLDATERFSESA